MDGGFLGVPDIDALTFSGLALASLCTAFVGMFTGAGGGPVLLGLMAMVMPPAVLLPVHTVVQLGVGGSRFVLLRRFILWPTMLPFLVGSLVGIAFGASIFVNLPTAVLQGIIGVFILLVAWMPALGRFGPERGRFVFLGSIMAFLAMFVSSTGPLLAPFVAAISPERRHYAGTTAALMSMVHVLKLIAFGLMGFAVGAYLPLMAAMVGTATLGNWLARHVLVRLPEHAFRVGLKIFLSVLAARLLWIAARNAGLI